jgi:putative sterol carrier protein
VPEFLSPAWLDLLGASLPATDPALQLRLRQIVTGHASYDVVIAGGAARIEPTTHESEKADLVLTVSFDVAVALASGRTNAHDALQAGEIKIAGDLRLLPTLAPALAALAPALADVRHATTYR